MRRFSIGLWIFLAALQSSAADVTLDNKLARCADVTLKDVQVFENLVFVRSTISLKSPIADCHCFSALASYESRITSPNSVDIVQEGQIGLMKSGDKTFVLSSEPLLTQGKKIKLLLQCQQPL